MWRRGFSSAAAARADLATKKWDAVVIGGGHNGLTAAAYLARSGLSVAVIERRHLVGGAAVTEELVPGFKFSRCSYLQSLLRPSIVKDLDLPRHGLKLLKRNPSSFTPCLDGRYLLLGPDSALNHSEISKFSVRDADAYPRYENQLEKFCELMESVLDSPPPESLHGGHSFAESLRGKMEKSAFWARFLMQARSFKQEDIVDFMDLLVSPASKSDVLKATLATDAVIGSTASVHTPGSGYVLLHHVMGGTDGERGKSLPVLLTSSGKIHGAILIPLGNLFPSLHNLSQDSQLPTSLLSGLRSTRLYEFVPSFMSFLGKSSALLRVYVEGGMGSVSLALNNAAREAGAHIVTGAQIVQLSISGDSDAVNGVLLDDGTLVNSSVVLSNATPYRTFMELLPQNVLPEEFYRGIKNSDYSSSMDCPSSDVASHFMEQALNMLAPFILALKTKSNEIVTLIVFYSKSMEDIHFACRDAWNGFPSRRPLIEMTIPSILDKTISPPGKHVINLFIQYTPYKPSGGTWEDVPFRESFAQRCFSLIDEYAPGFSSSVIGYDMLTPPDLEREFGLTGGNIFHGAMGLDSLFLMRPIKGWSGYKTPLRGLYLCGSGAHPGGGVMGVTGPQCCSCGT
ncbi:hypothetical protein Syun_015679 [Stephania yunnanensis]|uniref:Amine oxidase domain-containing protein n=1 Tax=Stephania yunnanensis TaxID=152371 RepID=A0AAP0JM02_9MAGN